jgi:AcrR family transcriptional regulator
VPRPRLHDPDVVLDAAEALAIRSGAAAVSIRAVSSATGVSNGALYHTFSSRGGLMAQTWLRAGRRFLDTQRTVVDEALAHPDGAVDAVVAAAQAPATFARLCPASAALLLDVRRDEVLADEVPEAAAAELRDLDTELTAVMVRLALALWERRDAAAVDVIAACIVDLPTALLLRRQRLRRPLARDRLDAAVRAVLAVGPPPPRTPTPKGSRHEHHRP